MNDKEKDELAPRWFQKWIGNDFFHYKLQLGKIEERVNLTAKLSMTLLGIVIAGFIALAITLIG